MNVFMFHLMPYTYLDMDFQKTHRACTLLYPNSNYDPVKGHELLNRYLDELELAAELGFDGISVNEHHQSAYGSMPSPVVIASALTRRTKDCKIAILGNAFGLREHPLTLAEEHAMIDVITGGRLITGMVRGIGSEYYAFGANPALSHERHFEAHDLVVRAWTEPGPFAFEGKHYHFEYVNIWPRPFQKPHPPIWTPSQGSMETIEWASDPARKYTYLQTYSPFDSVLKYLNTYRTLAEDKWGYTAKSEQIGWAAPVYVADTDAQAVEQAGIHVERMFTKFLSQPVEMQFPPGYHSIQSTRAIQKHKRLLVSQPTVHTLMEAGTFICGSPDTVRKKLVEAHRRLGHQWFLALLQFGTLPREQTERNIRLFATEVMPALQKLTDKEWVGVSKGETVLAG